MAQSKPYGSTQTRRRSTTTSTPTWRRARLQQGSTFKADHRGAALEAGIKPTQVEASPNKMPYPGWTTCSGENVPSDAATQNEDPSEGRPVPDARGLKKSINTYFVQLEAQGRRLPGDQHGHEARHGPAER